MKKIPDYRRSVCGSVFRPKSPLAGQTAEETARNFESQCDAAFASHICAWERSYSCDRR